MVLFLQCACVRVCVWVCVSVSRLVVLSMHTTRTNKPFNFPAASNCGILTFGSREQKWNGMRAKWPRMRTPVTQQHRVYTFSCTGAWPRDIDSSILKPRLHDTTCWQPVVSCMQPVVNAVVQPGLTTVLNEQAVRSTRLSNRLYNRFDNRLYCIV